MKRRSFTILETVLAASLASVVVLGCMGAFFALNRTDRTLSARFHEANDLARAQRTMQRAFTTLLLSPVSPLEEGQQAASGVETGPAGSAAGDAEPDEEADAAEVVPRPRILLEPDLDPTLVSVLRRSRYAAGGGGTSVATPQRLELVLSSVPIRPPAVQSTAWSNALVGVEDLDDPAVEGEEEYAGVRGAFALRPDDAGGVDTLARATGGDDRIGWTLWWQPLDDRSEPARIASGLAACHFQMFHGGEMLDDLVAYNASEMPTYIQLEIETLTGFYANYLFEVVWTVDVLEEEPVQTAAGGGGGGGRGGQGRDFAGGQDGQGQDGQGRSGQRGRDGRARPNPNSPQSGRPGDRVDPRRQPGQRPGDGQRRPGGPDGGGRPTGPGGGGGGRPGGPGGGGGGS